MAVVTTSRRPAKRELERAMKMVRLLCGDFLPREGRSLKRMMEEADVSGIVVVASEETWWEDRMGNRFRFHPNLAAIRVKELVGGGGDALVTAANLKQGDRVLDCTLGLGADSIVAAHVVGEKGEVIGLESQPLIAALVEDGMKHYASGSSRLRRAMGSVRVVCADYRVTLPRLEDQSFDVVMFDPMFRNTVKRSSGIQMLKELADPNPLDPDSVREAVRVARKRVVLKERLMSGEFERLGFRVVKEASNHAFGIIEP